MIAIDTKAKKGFTLIELIVVIAIMGIVSSAIYTILHMSMTSFKVSSDRVAAQSVARLALNDMKETLGVAKYVNMNLVKPDPLPTAGGYIYFDTIQGAFVVRHANGSEKLYNIESKLASDVQLYFDLVEPIVANTEYNTIRIIITIAGYDITTDVFVQNLAEFGGKITPDYDPTSALNLAEFVAFE